MNNYEKALTNTLKKFSSLQDGILFINKESKVVVLKKNNIIELRFIRPDNTFTTIQSKISISDPLDLLSDYAKSMSLLTGMVDDPKNIVILGAGGSILMSYFHNSYPNANVTGVEINREVINIAQNYFGFRSDDNFKLIEEDGLNYLKVQKNKIDILILDMFTNQGQPIPFTTVEFYELCGSILSETGVFCLNLHPGFLPRTVANLSPSFKYILKLLTEDSTTVFCFKNKIKDLDELKNKLVKLNNEGAFKFSVNTRIESLAEAI